MNRMEMMRVLKYSTEDLRDNRNGKMSESQFNHFLPPKISPIVYAVIIGHMVVIGGLLGIIAVLTGETVMWIILLVVLGLSALPFVMLQNEGNLKPLLRADVESGTVKKVCGMALVQERQGRRPYYTLTIEGITMKLNATQASVFKHGEDYCAYYLPQSQTLLSAEPM